MNAKPKMTKQDLNEAVEKMKETLSEDQLETMQAMAKKMSILIAIRDTNSSKDFDVLTESIWKAKDELVEKSLIKRVIEDYYPQLITEGLIDEAGQLSQDGYLMACHYDNMLNEDKIGDDSDRAMRAMIDPKPGMVMRVLDGASFPDYRVNRGDLCVCVDSTQIPMDFGAGEIDHAIAVVYDNDPARKVRLGYLEYLEVTGEKRKIGTEFKKEIKNMLRTKRVSDYVASKLSPSDADVLFEASKKLQFGEKLSPEEDRKYRIARARFDKVSKEAEKKIK